MLWHYECYILIEYIWYILQWVVEVLYEVYNISGCKIMNICLVLGSFLPGSFLKFTNYGVFISYDWIKYDIPYSIWTCILFYYSTDTTDYLLKYLIICHLFIFKSTKKYDQIFHYFTREIKDIKLGIGLLSLNYNAFLL